MKTMSIFLAIGEEYGEDCRKIIGETGNPIVGVLRRGEPHVMKPADVLISVGYDKIFTKKEISNYSRAYNNHLAMLPHNRGCLPINWAIWNQDPCGVTLHELTEGMDEGGIIDREGVTSYYSDTAYSIFQECRYAARALIRENIKSMLSPVKPKAIPQKGKGSYHKAGEFPNGRFIDLSWDADKIDRFIRAMSFPNKPKALLKIKRRIYELGYHNNSL